MMISLKYILVAYSIFASLTSSGQIMNAYGKVTAISGNVLTISDVNETNHTFNVGDQVIVMQMQDDVISGTSDDSSFGSLGTIGSAGLYEVATISGKTATTLTLTAPLANSYNTGTNSSVQVISFRKLGSPDYTTTSNISALGWDGNVGGVVAIQVAGTLTLDHDITANGAGFRGGAVSTSNGTVDCFSSWITNSSLVSGEKGEGIYKRTNSNYQYGRAKILNGGGGGNRHNAGGGGGGNVTAGGQGGPGYLCSGSPVGGHGGIALSSSISVSRIFMGGGGGGGQHNNGFGSSGAAGGGIILIAATQITTSGTCTARSVSANGATASSASNDGAGGGGGGGTIVFDVSSFSVSAGCTINVSANGGNGGSCLDAAVHGGGGGGGQGKVIYSSSAPSNVSTSTNNGVSGCNNNSSPCTNQAASAGGTNGSGISSNAGGTPLPVSLIYFAGSYDTKSGSIILKWATASEVNNDYFIIERSTDGLNFQPIGKQPGGGNTVVAANYDFKDEPSHVQAFYYRLSQVDFAGTRLNLKIIRVERSTDQKTFWVYPNPLPQSDLLHIDFQGMPHGNYTLSVFDVNGVLLIHRIIRIETTFQSVEMDTNSLSKGVYVVRINSDKNSTVVKRIVIR